MVDKWRWSIVCIGELLFLMLWNGGMMMMMMAFIRPGVMVILMMMMIMNVDIIGVDVDIVVVVVVVVVVVAGNRVPKQRIDPGRIGWMMMMML